MIDSHLTGRQRDPGRGPGEGKSGPASMLSCTDTPTIPRTPKNYRLTFKICKFFFLRPSSFFRYVRVDTSLKIFSFHFFRYDFEIFLDISISCYR